MKMKKNQEKIFIAEKIFACFCIALMLSMTFAAADSMNIPKEKTWEELQKELQEQAEKEQQVSMTPDSSEIPKSQNPFSLSSLFNLDILPVVSAQGNGCCVKLNNNGGYCKSQAESTECNGNGAGPFFNGVDCGTIIGDDCKVGTCIQQNGDCDFLYSQAQCKNQSSHFVAQATLIDECRPACCILKKGSEIKNTQFVYYSGKCELVRSSGGYDSVSVDFDKNYQECLTVLPPETMGYCSFTQVQPEVPKLCRYMKAADCTAQKGEFLGDKACTECKINDTKKCYIGSKGLGVYQFDSCNAPGDLVEACKKYDLCEGEGDNAACAEKKCTVGITYTSLNYDTAFFEKGKVEVKTSVTKDGSMQSAGYTFTLNPNGDAACVNYQGSGEEHYGYVCWPDGLVKMPIDPMREKVCDIKTENINSRDRYIPYPRDNEYEKCGDCGQENIYPVTGTWKFIRDFFGFIGADFLNEKWLDYWAFKPGLCNDKVTCRNLGQDCEHTSNDDCVPKYAPGHSANCTICMTTEASSPWHKCGDEVQCVSRGYCSHEDNSINPITATMICTAQTVAGYGVTQGAGWLLNQMGLKDQGAVQEQKAAEKKDAFDRAVDDFGKDFLQGKDLLAGVLNTFKALTGDLIRILITAPGKLIPGFGEGAVNSINNFFGWNTALKQQAEIKDINTEGDKLKEAENKVSAAITENAKTNKALEGYSFKEGKFYKEGKVVDTTDKNYDKLIELGAYKTYATANKNYNTAINDKATLFVEYIAEKDKNLGGKYDDDLKNALLNDPIFKKGGYTLKDGELYDKAGKKFILNFPGTSIQTAYDNYKGSIEYTKLQLLSKSGYSIKEDGKVYDNQGKEVSDFLVKIATPQGEKTLADVHTDYMTARIKAWDSLSSEQKIEAIKASYGKGSTGMAYAENYGGLMYKELGARHVEKKGDAISQLSAWYEAQGGVWGIFVHQLQATGIGLAVSTIWGIIKGITGYSSYVDIAQCVLNPKCVIKGGICYGLAGDPVNPVGFKPLSGVFGGITAIEKFWNCMGNGPIMPVIWCTTESLVMGTMDHDVCLPTNPWNMPGVPPGYANCKLCNDDTYRICTAARCQSLSSDGGCAWENGICHENVTMVQQCTENAPKIPVITGIDGFTKTSGKYTNDTNVTFATTTYNIILNTDLYSKCRWSIDKQNWKDMSPENIGKRHLATLPLSVELYEYHFYFQCENGCNPASRSDIEELMIKRSPALDTEGPIIIEKSPATDYLIEGTTSSTKTQKIEFWVRTNKAAKCKYKRYPFAEGAVGITTELDKLAQLSRLFSGTTQQLTGAWAETGISVSYTDADMLSMSTTFKTQNNATESIANNETKAFIILCNSTLGYISSMPSIVRFRASHLFDVDILEPKTGTTITEPQPEIKVSTPQNDTDCYYSLGNKVYWTNMTKFENTGYKEHSTTMEELLAYGKYTLWVTCYESKGNNIASDYTNFTIIQDLTPPNIIRVYQKPIENKLHISTDKLSKCQYNSTSFTYGKGQEMDGNNPASRDHETDWDTKVTYYIICANKFGFPGSMLTVKPVAGSATP
jgi:hypothetical protein